MAPGYVVTVRPAVIHPYRSAALATVAGPDQQVPMDAQAGATRFCHRTAKTGYLGFDHDCRLDH